MKGLIKIICRGIGLVCKSDLEGVMYKDTCDAKHEGDDKRFADLTTHINTRFDDLKTFIGKNGNSKT